MAAKKQTKKTQNILFLLFTLLSLILLFQTVFGLKRSNSSSQVPTIAAKEDKVIKVLDGDTVELETGERLRYLGIDAPEIDKKLGRQAKEFNSNLVLGRKVRIEFESVLYDKYDRLLGYVWIDDTLVNERLVKEGLARVVIIPEDPPLQPRYIDRLKKAEKEAREKNLGIWSD